MPSCLLLLDHLKSDANQIVVLSSTFKGSQLKVEKGLYFVSLKKICSQTSVFSTLAFGTFQYIISI